MDNTIQTIGEEICTGCATCSNTCPANAIVMQPNSEGFLFPIIDNQKCIQCGLCLKKCPTLSRFKYKNRDYNRRYYAFYASEELRWNSSSGAMFHCLAKYILECGGVVCGCRYSDDYRTAYHTIINSLEELQPLQKSKYFQSEIRDVFKKVANYLHDRTKVLFVGTPCQVDGLLHYLGGDNDGLITIDIVCHGVPSPKAHQAFLDEHSSEIKEIKKVDYRDKSIARWGTVEYIEYSDGTNYYNDVYNGTMWMAFLNGISTRLCCGTCGYANPDRVGDLTLGDFWGIDVLDRAFANINGVSLVSVNTKKGDDLFNAVKENGVWKRFESEEVEKLARTRNGQLISPRETHYAHKRFYEYLDKGTLSNAVHVAADAIYDVAIVGWWYNLNYGGTLTYYALNKTLCDMGFSVLMVNRKSNDPQYRPDYNSVPYRFAQKKYWISKVHTSDSIYSLNDKCKIFISGSDQLFNPMLWRYSGPEYFLDFVNVKNRKISYASSFGQQFEDVPGLTERMRYWLKRFDAISVREDYAADILKDVFEIDAPQVLDPVFLCDKEAYMELAESSNVKESAPFFVAFTLDPSEERRNCIKYVQEKLGIKNINLINADNIEENKKKLDLPNTKANVDIEDWLFYYKNADFIITDSFHGTCFAIIFHKPFISIANKQRGVNRFKSILRVFDLEDRLVDGYEEIVSSNLLCKEIDWDAVDAIWDKNKEKSRQWLYSAITDGTRCVSDFSAISSKLYELERRISKLEKTK